MLWDYFLGALSNADQRRRKELASVRTTAELTAVQNRARQTLRAGIGSFPERTPLRARQVGEIVRTDYIIEKVIFESRPEYYVTANVYRPKAADRAGPLWCNLVDIIRREKRRQITSAFP